MPPHVQKGTISVAFVCPSVCPSVAYIAIKSRIRRPSVSKFGRKVAHLWCDSHTSFNVKRSKVTRPINADTHRAPYLPNGKTYELQTWYTDGGWRHASATGAMTSNVKGQGHEMCLSRLKPMLYLSLEAGGACCVGQTWWPHFLFYIKLNSTTFKDIHLQFPQPKQFSRTFQVCSVWFAKGWGRPPHWWSKILV